MKKFFHSRYGASKGAALIIVLGFVVLVTALALAHFSRTTTDRQLAQSSFNDTSADLLARSGLDIVVASLKQEIVNAGAVAPSNVQPQRSGNDVSIPNLVRRSVRNDPIPAPPGVPSRASAISSAPVDPANPKRGEITFARWNSHYLIPSTATFTAPDWVLVTPQGPNTAPPPNSVIGRYAFAVYDEGGLIDINVGGFPTYANLTLPTRPTRRLRPKYPLEESEIILVAGQAPQFSPDHFPATGGTGTPFSAGPFHVHPNADSFGSLTPLPHGLFVNPSDGSIYGTPTSPGTFTVTLTATNQNGTGTGTLNLTITGLPSPDSTPWAVNLARKGTVAFADLTALPSTPAITTTQINKLMGWRNYATTQQPPSSSFNSPSFPPDLTHEEYYAKYFLGAALPFAATFTTVSAAPNPLNPTRTDQAVMTRQELIKLQRAIGFSQDLLQYLGTFSREHKQNRPAPDWPGLTGQLAAARWDMNNLAMAIPDSWIVHHGNGHGHAWGLQKHSFFAQMFGLTWVNGNFNPATRSTDPNYYGHWKYIHNLGVTLPANPDFFQIIDYAMNQANGGTPDPNHVRNTFNVGAALIDQFDTDDLQDPDPNLVGNGDGADGNTITIIDYGGTSYAYGMEGMSFDDPNDNPARPWLAPTPPLGPPVYGLLNRRFENVGEFGYAYNPGSTTPGHTLDFASATSHDKPMLDLFTYNTAGGRAGIVNLNTRNGPVVASIIRGAWVDDPGAEIQPPTPPVPPTTQVTQADALAAGQAIVQATAAAGGAAVNRGDVARLAAAAVAAVPNLAGSDEARQTIARALAETTQARTWNLMIDVIAQTGQYAPGTNDLTDPNKFIVQGEKRYWLHIALDRDDGSVLGTQLEEVVE